MHGWSIHAVLPAAIASAIRIGDGGLWPWVLGSLSWAAKPRYPRFWTPRGFDRVGTECDDGKHGSLGSASTPTRHLMNCLPPYCMYETLPER